MMMVMGGNVNGGKVHGQWPGMAEGQLIGPGDLAVTTDYRDVLSEILTKRLNNPATNEIFPEYQPKILECFEIIRGAEHCTPISLRLLTAQIHSNIIPIRAIGKISIPNAHFGGAWIQDRIAVDLVAHPPAHRGLRTAAPVDDFL